MKTRRSLTVVAVLLAMFMAAMEATVIATAMPTVVADLGGIELYGWVGAIYMLASTVTMPLYGKLSDLYGRKPMLLVGLGIFVLGSVASGLSTTMTQLIVFRALQGLGAGGIQPVALTIVGDIFTPQERARIQGIFGAVWGIAGMAGPLLGGVIVRALSWHWVFFVNVPFGALAALVLMTSFFETPQARKPRIDYAGMTLLGAFVVALLMGASRYRPELTLPLALVLLVAFVIVEGRVAEPVLPIALLRRRLIAGLVCRWRIDRRGDDGQRDLSAALRAGAPRRLADGSGQHGDADVDRLADRFGPIGSPLTAFRLSPARSRRLRDRRRRGLCDVRVRCGWSTAPSPSPRAWDCSAWAWARRTRHWSSRCRRA